MKATVSGVLEDLTFKRGNAQKGLLAHLAALFLIFLVFEFFSFGPPLETMKKSSVSSDLNVSFKQPQKNKRFLKVSLKTVKN